MRLFNNLDAEEKDKLLKFPAYISLLAANSNDKLDETERKEAIKFAHIKTYSCKPILSEFYEEAEKVFEKNIDMLDRELPTDKTKRDIAIKKELSKLELIVQKLGEKYTNTMHKSMNTFKDHVLKAHHNVIVDFIFPIPIHGLSGI